jgi:Mrp family chromosome partitioning ATPase
VNLATAAAYDARTTLLVDGEMNRGLVASLLRVRRAPGLAEILAGQVDWTEAVVPASVGRDRTLDVITSGARDRDGTVDASPMRRNLGRIAHRYDFVILVASPAHIQLGAESMLPSPDLIYCVSIGVTRLADAVSGLDRLRGIGARIRGTVLWDAAAPDIEDSPPPVEEPAHPASPAVAGGRPARDHLT